MRNFNDNASAETKRRSNASKVVHSSVAEPLNRNWNAGDADAAKPDTEPPDGDHVASGTERRVTESRRKSGAAPGIDRDANVTSCYAFFCLVGRNVTCSGVTPRSYKVTPNQ